MFTRPIVAGSIDETEFAEGMGIPRLLCQLRSHPHGGLEPRARRLAQLA